MPVAAAGLLLAAALLCRIYRREVTAEPLAVPPPRSPQVVQTWTLAASLAVGTGMVAVLVAGIHPAAAAMTAAAVVVLAGATRPRRALQEVDWSLLLLFAGLFVVMRAVEEVGLARTVVTGIAGPLSQAGALASARFAAAVTVLSQLVSNVPAVMLFVPSLETLAPGTAGRLWLGLAAFRRSPAT